MTRTEIRKAAYKIALMRRDKQEALSKRKEARKWLEAYQTAVALTRLLDDDLTTYSFESVY